MGTASGPYPRYSLYIFCAVALVCAAASSTGLTRFEYSTANSADLLPSSSGATTVQEAVNSDRWLQTSAGPSFGYLSEPGWIRFPVPQGADVLLLPGTWIAHFDLYFVASKRVLTHYPSGHDQPPQDRPIAHPQNAFPIPPAPAGVPVSVVIHHTALVQAAHYPAEFFSTNAFHQHSSQTHLLHGLFYGISAVLLIYNLAVFWAVRDKTYWYFLLYNLGLVGFLAGSDGFARFYLWPNLPLLEKLTPLWLGLAMLTLPMLVKHYLSITSTERGWQNIVRTLQCMTLATILPATFLSLNASASWVAVIVAVEAILLFLLVLRHTVRGNLDAGAFLLANGLITAAAMYIVLAYFGLLPDRVDALD